MDSSTAAGTPRPKRMLTNNNKDLARTGIFVFTLPALTARLPDGRRIKTCPAAGMCSKWCYARNGSYLWPTVLAAHTRNLAFILEDPDGWQAAMTAELTHRRFEGKAVRVHDSGDFFSDDYTRRWLEIMTVSPGTFFYAYTKEVHRFKRLVEGHAPDNFRWVYSLGGREDHLIDREHDRYADVFAREEDIAAAGYHSQAESDLLAVLGPSPVGMRANAIPRFQRRQGPRTLGEWQAENPHPRKPPAAPSEPQNQR